MKPLNECQYYLVRAMYGLGASETDEVYADTLEHIRRDGLAGWTRFQVDALIDAAARRGRLAELDHVVSGEVR